LCVQKKKNRKNKKAYKKITTQKKTQKKFTTWRKINNIFKFFFLLFLNQRFSPAKPIPKDEKKQKQKTKKIHKIKQIEIKRNLHFTSMSFNILW
jgi:hypothetical protein